MYPSCPISLRARAVREVRAGPVLGDQVVRGALDRRLHPLPALPQRHLLVQEETGGGGGGFRGARRPKPCHMLREAQQQRRPPVGGVRQPGEEAGGRGGLGSSGHPSALLRSFHNSSRLVLIRQLAARRQSCRTLTCYCIDLAELQVCIS
jgi:hypothetical protein